MTQPGATAGSAARLVASLRNLYVVSGLLRLRRDLLTRALDAAQRALDRGGEANVQKALGDLALREADLGEARRRYESALAIYPQIGTRLGEAAVHVGLGRLTDEEQYFERALAIHAQIRSYYDVAVDSYYFGRSQLKLKNLARARELLTAARDVWTQIGLDTYAQTAQSFLDEIPQDG